MQHKYGIIVFFGTLLNQTVEGSQQEKFLARLKKILVLMKNLWLILKNTPPKVGAKLLFFSYLPQQTMYYDLSYPNHAVAECHYLGLLEPKRLTQTPSKTIGASIR
jgi:hypothetical protein